MDNVLGQPGALGKAPGDMTQAPATNPLVNPASMQPGAMANLMGSPLSNGGSNMMPYMQMQEAFTPKPLQSSSGLSSSPGYNQGGLIHFADGGMPMPPQAGAPMPPEGGALAQQAGAQDQAAGPDPQLVQEIEQVFQQNMQNPQMLAQELLKIVMREIKKVVSPEELKHLQTPQGQQELQQIVQQLMQSMKGGLGQMAGGDQGGGGGGPPSPPESAPPPTGGLAQSGA
jgi:hypothetical protein